MGSKLLLTTIMGVVIVASFVCGQSPTRFSSTMMPMSSDSTSSPRSVNMVAGAAIPTSTSSPSTVTDNNSNSSDDADADTDWNSYTANLTSMDSANATAQVYDDMSDIVQLTMNATAFLFTNKEIQSFMSAQDGMDWMWKPQISARWCKEACVAVNKTMCPNGELDQPMLRTDSCRTCVLECLACTMEDNYWMTLRSYVMSLLAPVIQLASSTMAVDTSDINQANLAQTAQQNMYQKFNAAVSPLANRMMLDKMFGLNCMMFTNYQGPTDTNNSTSSSSDALTNNRTTSSA